MIELSTFWILAIVFMLSVTVLIISVGVLRRKDKLSIGVSLLGAYIVMEVIMVAMLIPIDTYYIDTKVISDIVSIESNETGEGYIVEVKDGKKYNMSEALSSDKNFISLGCKLVDKNILGLELYEEKDLLFVNVAEPEMSESEKEFLLDRVAPKS